ncbi:regulator of G-protein signaling 22 isoform X1 [Alosa sapidissima]|uniref:regulator of G-protein signaling 22 isoform X1 n=1 Tax=Alosa sapidissima TaxID=34773 RepID=UPI001C090D2B|nr:regulator of G-protein signaling 22 isoform X1 [Alosa sapidissima]
MLVNTDSSTLWNSSLEDKLANDDALVEFLNAFLSLPTFPETIKYNTETGAFEVVSDAAETLHSRIRTTLHEHEAKFLANSDSPWLTAIPMFDNSYTVLCLDRDQGMKWVNKSRLPLFLQSDYFFEYRLVKLLCQLVCPGQRLDNASASALCSVYPQPPTHCAAQDLNKDRVSFIKGESQAAREHRNGSDRHAEARGVEAEVACLAEARGVEAEVACLAEARGVEAEAEACLYFTESTEQEEATSPSTRPGTADLGEGRLITSLVNHVLQVAVSELQVGTARVGLDTHQRAPGATELVPHTACAAAEMNEFNSGSATDEPAGGHGHCLCFHGSRQALEDFKRSLQGTPGEKVLQLWMDIERLRILASPKTKNRHLVKMRHQYMPSSGFRALSSELLSRLGLASSSSWIEDKLLHVQPCLSETLLTYWGPLFCLVRSASERRRLLDPQQQPHWQKRRLHSSAAGGPNPSYITLPPVQPHLCKPRAPPSTAGQPLSGSSTPALKGRLMERMLQALHVEPRAGFYFTRFCELSGNKLWESAIHFWTDLQEYQQLFYQDGLDPYRARRKAQVLYSTYLCSESQESIGVGEECMRQVFVCLTPPFEELFDGAEEHTLSLLLEPWTLLTSQDTDIYEQVDLWEETRHDETADYRKLQVLHTESVRRMEQLARERKSAPPPPEVPREPDSWAQVPQQFRGFRLVSVLRNRTELQHFQAFLEENSASMDLLCWLDLEQLKRTSSQQQEERAQRFCAIKTKYLNRKYFFGPGSPATKHQQEEVIRLAGGWGQLLQNGLSGAPLTEMQNIVRDRIERKWLPVYLSTPDFSERQKLQPQTEDHRRRYHRRRKQPWKLSQQADSAWMASSREVLAFRQALLNPVTCLQFQRFVVLKGDLYENDVLFWLEVQRYKDLCHSHCDEATVQHKISTIISCFISSSVPPALQISVPPEQARTILDQRRELGPYVFREAQMSVFSELYKLWPPFLDFKSRVGEGEDLLSVLERKRARQRERELQRRRAEEEEEERKAQQEALSKQQWSSGSVCEEAGVEGSTEHHVELLLPTDQLSWSYSKYMAALERESVLIRKQMMQEEALASFSTGRDSVSTPSVRSEVGRRPPGHNPAATPRTHTPEATGANTLTGEDVLRRRPLSGAH